MSGKMPAEWWREYRRKNRAKLNVYERERRKRPEVKAKRAEYRHRPEVRERQNDLRRGKRVITVEPLPNPYTGHPILELARSLAGFWYGTTAYDADKEDAAGEAVLAILEGRDPREAVRSFRAQLVARRSVELELEL